ncbi:MAG: hypothetical protein JNM27_00560 [Leptospirales bacterium]|nr:hypothetical protein [Leptospirales bacterium]
MNKRNIIIGLAVIAGILGIIIFFLLSRDPENIRQYRQQAEGRFDDPSQKLAELAQGGAPVPYAEVLNDYTIWAKFPPNSRPLKPEYLDVIEYKQIALPYQAMVTVKDGQLKAAQFECKLQPVKHTVLEGETLDIQLECRNPENGQGTAAKLESVRLERYIDDKTFGVPEPQVKPGTAENGFKTIIAFKPRREDWGDMQLSIKFGIPAENSGFVHDMKVHFFSSPVTPATFTGNFRERIESGSLIISAELDVRMPGRYTIEGNLFAAEDKPVAHAKSDARLTGGKQMVDLLFFGKIFHERRASGPYILKGLRGIQETSALDPELLNGPQEQVNKLLETLRTTEPDHRTIPEYDKEFTTQPYKLADFSDAEYDSDLKRERIKELKQLAESE